MTPTDAQGYRERIVSFIDILGFANAIERSSTDPALTEDLRKVLTTAPFSSPMYGPPNYPAGRSYCRSVQSTNFSDSVVISCDKSVDGLLTVIEMSRAFSCVLLQFGLLARGGVAIGQLIHERSIIFGPGLVNAYHLESREAKVARIVIGTDAALYVEDCAKEQEDVAEYLKASLRIDDDGFAYMHVLRELEEDAGQSADKPFHEWWWGTARKSIVDALAAAKGQPYLEKVDWFRRYYNRQLPSHGINDPAALNNWRSPIE